MKCGQGRRALRHGLWMLLLIPVGTCAIAALLALALRRRPGRIALAFALRAAFLAAIGQTLMPLLVPAWLAISARLLQRGLRP